MTIIRRTVFATAPILEVTRHHEVLEEWAQLRQTLGSAPYLVTLDHHTDFRDAFYRASSAHLASGVSPNPAAWSARLIAAMQSCDPAIVQAATKLLENDEHIDAARQAGIITTPVFLLQSDIAGFTPSWANITHLNVNTRSIAAKSIDDGVIIKVRKDLEAAAGRNISGDINYILDIDHDFFRSRAALSPTNNTEFHRLMKYASAVTMAHEPTTDYNGRKIDNEFISKKLLSHISLASVRRDI